MQGQEGGSDLDAGNGLAFEAPWPGAEGSLRFLGPPARPTAGSEPSGREGRT